jgi:hypothetical protein
MIIRVVVLHPLVHINTTPSFLDHEEKILMKGQRKVNLYVALVIATVGYSLKEIYFTVFYLPGLLKNPTSIPRDHHSMPVKFLHPFLLILNLSSHINFCYLSHGLLPMALSWLHYSNPYPARSLMTWHLSLLFWKLFFKNHFQKWFSLALWVNPLVLTWKFSLFPRRFCLGLVHTGR